MDMNYYLISKTEPDSFHILEIEIKKKLFNAFVALNVNPLRFSIRFIA